MASSSQRKGLLEDTVVATPMPQASSTVDKYKINGWFVNLLFKNNHILIHLPI